ncbi:DUF1097 family protein [Acetobacterium malicum]|uniref:DUF1097 family protein n=1 Tax=Acetobacterium malicum TaxID=52692 RepID=UPI000400ECE7|nr:DUF1097 family protein [Acetobacterium dehalogenans]
MKKYMWTWAICMAALAAIYGLIYSFTPLNTIVPGGYLWISLGALAVYFCEGAEIKLLPNYTASTVAGLVWGFLGITAVGLMIGLGLSPTLSTCVVLFFVTLMVVGFHIILLEKSWFNKAPMVFATLAFVFSQGGQNILYIAFSVMGGFLLGIAISTTGAFLNKKMLS